MSKCAEYLRRVGRLDGLKPLGGTPTEGAMVVQMPPSEAVSTRWAPDHHKYVSFCKHPCRLMVETSLRAEAKSSPFRAHHPDAVPHADTPWWDLGRGGRLDREEQHWIKTLGLKVLLPNGAEFDRFPRRCVHVPLYPSSFQVLDNHAWLNSELPNRGSEYAGATLIHVESEEAEAQIVSSLSKILTESVGDQLFRYWGRARSAMAQELWERTQLDVAGILGLLQTGHSCALKILNKVTILVHYFCDGRSPSPKTAVRVEEG